jgi:hypothetical protein
MVLPFIVMPSVSSDQARNQKFSLKGLGADPESIYTYVSLILKNYVIKIISCHKSAPPPPPGYVPSSEAVYKVHF